MSTRIPIVPLMLVLAGPALAADTPALREPGRGELLYATHCIACHDAQPR
ncbi:hypothetical protein [Pseudothauera rhizosphaerae]|nr:hypothetical protein [Pseudothauera rhizosphaerae]